MTNLSPVDIAKRFAMVLLIGAALMIVSSWGASAPLAPEKVRKELLRDPEQISFAAEDPESTPFLETREGVSYTITPKFRYVLRGLVVSQHESSSWLDLAHQMSSDHLNTKDICVIWGQNARSPYLNEMTFSSGDWTCYASTPSRDAWDTFRLDQLSNNHLLPATPALARALASTRIGDQIEISGALVEYKNHKTGSVRGTSVTRTDTDNGACETIYVKGFKILSRGHQAWYQLKTLGKALCWLGLAGIVFALFIRPFLRKPETQFQA